jgi:putative toxin-antitoxin system antitoxin component (TIGR02293 family)
MNVLSPAIMSDRTAARRRLGSVKSHAQAVFGDYADAAAFLKTPHPELDGLRPIEAAASEAGAARVERILNALAHGLPV